MIDDVIVLVLKLAGTTVAVSAATMVVFGVITLIKDMIEESW